MPSDETRAKRIVHGLNAAGALGFLASFAARSVSLWLLLPALILPIIALVTAFRLRPWVRLDGGQGTAPRLALCLTLCSLALGAFGLYAPLLDAAGLAWVGATCFAALFLVCARRLDAQTDKLTLGFLLFAGGCYGYGLPLALNMLLDSSAPRLLEAPIVDKWLRSKSRGSADPELHVAVPETQGVAIDVVVTSEEYARCSPGQQVVLRVYPGALGLRWYEVARTCVQAVPR